MEQTELLINEEFKNLIPSLIDNEYAFLEKSIIKEGCRDALVVWEDTIIDGHNRYNICKKHGIEFEIINKDFEDLNDAKVWIIENQKGRRNLTDGWKWELAQTKKKILAEKHEQERKKARVSNSDTRGKQPESGRTQKSIAQDLGWSTGKVAQADYVWDKANDVIKQKTKDGSISINQAYQTAKKEEKQKEVEQKKQEYSERIEKAKAGNVIGKIDIFNTDKKFRIIYADPPWEYNLEQTSPQLGGAIKHYDSMSIDDLCSLPIKNITEKDAVLFLWATSPKLNLFPKIMDSWGFEYKTSFVWDKISHNVGHYNSVRHEFLLIGGKGRSTPDIQKLYDSVQSIQKPQKHSKKPVEFINIIDELYVTGNRIELFARKPSKTSWYYWGNEV